MADPKKTAAAAAASTVNEPKQELTLDNFTQDDDDDGIVVTGRSALYSPDQAMMKNGKRAYVEGWLNGTKLIKSAKYKDKEGRPTEKTYLVVSLTEPTICSANQQPFVMPSGDALVALAKSMEDGGWEEKATHEEYAFKVRIKFIKKDVLPNGNNFWHTEIRVLDVKLKTEVAEFSPEAMQKALAAATAAKQIAQSAS